jgi:hypothetical protein
MANVFDQFDSEPESLSNKNQNASERVNSLARFLPESESLSNKNQNASERVNSLARFLPKTGVETELESGNWTNWDSTQGAGLVLEGMTLGWSDEALTAIASVIETGTSDTNEDYTTIYRRNKDVYDKQKAKFKQENPATSFGLELAGGFLSPGGVFKNMGMVGRAVTEGAIYGAGASEGDTAAAVATDALLGAGAGAVIGSGLRSVQGLFSRRVSTELGEGADFIPLTLSAEKGSFLQKMYQDVVGPSFGGKGIIRAQEDVVVKPLLVSQRNRENILKDTASSAKKAVSSLKNQLTVSLDKATNKLKGSIQDTKDVQKLAETAIESKYGGLLGKEGLVVARQARQIAEVIDEAENTFRFAAFSDSLPTGLSKVDVEDILTSATPNVAMAKLDRAWGDNGFSMLKDRKFRMAPTQLKAEIEKRIQQDPLFELMAESKGSISTKIDGVLEAMSTRADKRGFIAGKDLADLRAALGTAAAKSSDAGGESVILKALYSQVQKIVDDKMVSQLSPKSAELFKLERSRWQTNTVLRDAVFSSSKKTGTHGKFTPDDWMNAIATNSARQARGGKGPLADIAQDLSNTARVGEKTIKETTKDLTFRISERKEREIQRQLNKAKAERTSLTAKNAKLKGRLMGSSEKAQEFAANTNRLQELEKEAAAHAEDLATIQASRVNENPSWFHTLYATQFLGLPQAAALGLKAAGYAVGAAGGAKLAEPSAQRLLAGQTGVQKAGQALAASQAGQALIGGLPAIIRQPSGMLASPSPQEQQ